MTTVQSVVLPEDLSKFFVGASRIVGTPAPANEADPHGKDPHAPGAKLDNGKVLPWLCITGFSKALEAVAEVTTVGARKYTPNGWLDVPNGQERYMEAFGRHMLKLAQGETHDNGPAGTGCHHKAQMIWNLLASLELELRAQANQTDTLIRMDPEELFRLTRRAIDASPSNTEVQAA